MGEFRRALAELVASVAADASYPQELSRKLSIDKSLSWKVSRVIRADDLLSAVPHIPGRAGLRIVLQSAERAGAPAGYLAALQTAEAKLDEFIDAHCGDRETFATMGGSASHGTIVETAESHRKLAFRGQSATLGVRARTQISVQFVAPSQEDPTQVDLASIGGLVDFRRLRPDVTGGVCVIANYIGDNEDARTSLSPEPLDGRYPPTAAPLLGEFGTSPVPQLCLQRVSQSSVRLELTEGEVGNTAAATCVGGWLYRLTASRSRTDVDEFGEHLAFWSTPTEAAVHDVYMHKSMNASEPTGTVYSNLPQSKPFEFGKRASGILPLGEVLREITDSGPKYVIPEFPRYSEMVEYTCRKVGWNLADFRVFRMRVEYPPVPAVAVIRYHLKDAPKG